MNQPLSLTIGSNTCMISYANMDTIFQRLDALKAGSPIFTEEQLITEKTYRVEPHDENLLRPLRKHKPKLEKFKEKADLPSTEDKEPRLPLEQETAVIKALTDGCIAALKNGTNSDMDIVGIDQALTAMMDYLSYYNLNEKKKDLVSDILPHTYNTGWTTKLAEIILGLYESELKIYRETSRGKTEVLAEQIKDILSRIGVNYEDYNRTRGDDSFESQLECMIVTALSKRAGLYSTVSDLTDWMNLAIKSPDVVPEVRALYSNCVQNPEIATEVWDIYATCTAFAKFGQTVDAVLQPLEKRLAEIFIAPDDKQVEDAWLIPNGMQGHTKPKKEGSIAAVGVTSTIDGTYLLARNKDTGFTSLIAINGITHEEQIRAGIRYFLSQNKGAKPDNIEVTLIGSKEAKAADFNGKDVKLLDESLNEPSASENLVKTLRACAKENLKISRAHLFDERIPFSFCVNVAPGEAQFQTGVAKTQPVYFSLHSAIIGIHDREHPIVTDIAFTPDRSVYNPLFLTHNCGYRIAISHSKDSALARETLYRYGFNSIQVPVLSQQIPALERHHQRCIEQQVHLPIREFVKKDARKGKRALNTETFLPVIESATSCGVSCFAIGCGADLINDRLKEYCTAGSIFTITERRYTPPTNNSGPGFIDSIISAGARPLIGNSIKPNAPISGSIIGSMAHPKPAITTGFGNAAPTTASGLSATPTHVQYVVSVSEKSLRGYHDAGMKAAQAFSSVTQFAPDLKLRVPEPNLSIVTNIIASYKPDFGHAGK